MNLTDLYNKFVSEEVEGEDLEKQAEKEAQEIVDQAETETNEEQEKIAQAEEYVTVGRILARMDMQKFAEASNDESEKSDESDKDVSIKDSVIQEMLENPEYAQQLKEKWSE